ncbi:MAG: hypothetical protein DHS20C16_17080 [Phycisphaerae bacterium]|nr:MAG: hypothetical protein DHS20C16_17080 [Phycisphaerae bacterium]
MVEQNDSLATWQLLKDPTINPTAKIEARRVADHRKAYLEYEGPVSHGRGIVKQIESGTCIVEESTSTACTVELEGTRLTGHYKLRRSQDDRWTWLPQSHA